MKPWAVLTSSHRSDRGFGLVFSRFSRAERKFVTINAFCSFVNGQNSLLIPLCHTLARAYSTRSKVTIIIILSIPCETEDRPGSVRLAEPSWTEMHWACMPLFISVSALEYPILILSLASLWFNKFLARLYLTNGPHSLVQIESADKVWMNNWCESFSHFALHPLLHRIWGVFNEGELLHFEAWI